MEPKAVIFDLDGTLTESGEGIIKAAIAGLAAVGRESGGTEKLQKLIGPPLTEGFSEVYGLTEDECKVAVRAFRAYYETQGIFENELYPGALNLLRTLRELGTALYLATSKPELQARRVLAAFSLTAYFKGIAGGAMIPRTAATKKRFSRDWYRHRRYRQLGRLWSATAPTIFVPLTHSALRVSA